MKSRMLAPVLLLSAFYSTSAFAACEENVDRIETFYINGMFTGPADFIANKNAINAFLRSYLSGVGFESEVKGSYNDSETALLQILEVGRQKLEDASATATDAILQFLNGDDSYLNDPNAVKEVQSFLQDIATVYTGTLSEADTIKAKSGVTELLDTC